MRDLEHGERRYTGREPREPHQREPDDEREDTACDGGEEQRRHVSHRAVAEEAGEARHDRRLLGNRHREHTGQPRSNRDEADVPERQDARIADEDVEGDDDRDLHERVDEVALARLRHERADERRDDDEYRGRGELHERDGLPHTRSPDTFRANRPFGRSTRIAIITTKAKRLR